MKSILVIEDDRDVARLVQIHLRDMGFEVTHAYDGQEGLMMALNHDYALIVLDIMLPTLDGFEVCRRIRMEKNNTPILMLTSRSEDLDKVLGLEIGADDYLTKPFVVRELTARVKAILRRVEITATEQREAGQRELRFDSLYIHVEKRIVEVRGARVELSPKEFDLLVLFASHPGRTYTRGDLLNLIWGHDFNGYEHTVNSHINRLRSKIEEDMSNPKFILTTWGVGYKFNDDLNDGN